MVRGTEYLLPDFFGAPEADHKARELNRPRNTLLHLAKGVLRFIVAVLGAYNMEYTMLKRQEIRTRDLARRISNTWYGIMGWWHTMQCNLISTKRMREGFVSCQILQTIVRTRITMDAFHWLTACSLNPRDIRECFRYLLISPLFVLAVWTMLTTVSISKKHLSTYSVALLSGVSRPRPLLPLHLQERLQIY